MAFTADIDYADGGGRVKMVVQSGRGSLIP